MAATIPAVSVEYLKAPITASVTLDTQPIDVAFEPKTKVAPDGSTTWHAAAWVGAAGTTRTWQLLIGPGTSVILAAGQYNVWSRVTDSPEIPIRLHDVLTLQ